LKLIKDYPARIMTLK